MTEKERFMTDDAGTLIDLFTRETYDMVEEVVDILNNYENNVFYKDKQIKELEKEIETLQDQLAHEEQRIEALESGFIKDLEAMDNDCMKCEKKYHELIKELEKENEELKWSKKILRANKKDCELGRKYEREQWLKMDNMRVEHIRFLQKRLKKNGLSIYMNDGDIDE